VGSPLRKPPRHVAATTPPVFWFGGVLLIGGGGWVLAAGNVLLAVSCFAMTAGLVALARWRARQVVAVHLANTAVQQLMRGDLVAATTTLDTMPARSLRIANIRRGVSTLRAMIALYEGRLDEAARFATIAIEGRRSFLTALEEGPQIAAAHGVRGLARAALGEDARAKLDADAAESSVDATAEVIARARLVRAVLASRAAYHEEAFRAYLAANARLVLEHAMPRERALFRALRRLSRSPQRSVYREQGRMKDDQAPSKLASWIAYVAPEAAAYVEGDRMLADRADDDVIPSGVPSDVRALSAARASATSTLDPARRRRRLVALWGALAAVTLAAWSVLTPAPHAASTVSDPTPIGPSSWSNDAVSILLPLGLSAIFYTVLTALRRRRSRTLSLARRLSALGDRARAKPTLVRLTASGDGITAAGAGLELARMAATEADFAEAIARCDAAIARVSKEPLRTYASPVLLPALMTESAVAMAARGGLEDADAELAILCRDFPTYPRLSSSLLRVRLLRAMRAGERDAACAIARSRTADLPLPYREDVLADLALASRGDATDEDLARLDAELHDDAELRSWIDAVAPGLRADRGAPRRRPRIVTADAAAVAAAAAEMEVLETTAETASAKRVGTNG
jgi:hypothetical protein